MKNEPLITDSWWLIEAKFGCFLVVQFQSRNMNCPVGVLASSDEDLCGLIGWFASPAWWRTDERERKGEQQMEEARGGAMLVTTDETSIF